MSCPYCTESKHLLERSEHMSFKGDFFPGIDVFIDNSIVYIEVAPDTYEPSFMEREFKINYCPMCGEKL